MNYKHLTINERSYIYQFEKLGISVKKIAEAIDRSSNTVSR